MSLHLVPRHMNLSAPTEDGHIIGPFYARELRENEGYAFVIKEGRVNKEGKIRKKGRSEGNGEAAE